MWARVAGMCDWQEGSPHQIGETEQEARSGGSNASALGLLLLRSREPVGQIREHAGMELREAAYVRDVT